MKKVNILRNMAIVFACLAVTAMFSGCDPTNGPGKGDSFTKKTFTTSEELQAFIPAGIYVFGGAYYGSSKNFVAFGTDGSFLNGTLNDSPKVVVCLNKGATAYNVLWDTDIKNPQWVRQEYYNVPTDDSGVYEGYDYKIMSIYASLLTWFITSDNCEKQPTHVYNDKAAGVSVKHYVYEATTSTIVTTSEYWVTSSGLCLKYKYSMTVNNVPSGVEVDSVTLLKSNVGDFNNVLGQLPKFDRATTTIPNYSGLFRVTYKKYANEWLYDQYTRDLDNWIKVYSAPGTINYMEVWHNPEQVEFGGWTDLTVSIAGADHQDILNYIASVMTIGGMTQNSFSDQEVGGQTFLMFEADNSSIVVNSGDDWVYYKVSFYNNTLTINIHLWYTFFV